MIEDYEKRNQPKQDWMVNVPVVPVELLWFWDAFWELDSERLWSKGLPRSIPWSKIKEYALYHEMDFDYVLKMVRALDNELLKFKRDQHEKQIKEDEQKAKQGAKGRKRVKRR